MFQTFELLFKGQRYLLKIYKINFLIFQIRKSKAVKCG